MAQYANDLFTQLGRITNPEPVYSNLEWEDIDHTDYPDYCDAYVCSGLKNGVEMDEADLEELNGNTDLLHRLLFEHLN